MNTECHQRSILNLKLCKNAQRCYRGYYCKPVSVVSSMITQWLCWSPHSASSNRRWRADGNAHQQILLECADALISCSTFSVGKYAIPYSRCCFRKPWIATIRRTTVSSRPCFDGSDICSMERSAHQEQVILHTLPYVCIARITFSSILFETSIQNFQQVCRQCL